MNNIDDFEIFSLDSLKIGDSILYDLYISIDGSLKLVSHSLALLDEDLKSKLNQHKALYIKKDEKLTINKNNIKHLIRQKKDNTKEALEVLYGVSDLFFDKFYKDKDDKLDVECMKSIVSSTILLLRYNERFINETMAFFIKEHTLSSHSLQVCIYSLRLGMLLKLSEEELVLLGIASLVHDIGYKKLPFDAIEKNEIFSDEEFELMKDHTNTAVDILLKNGIKNKTILDGVKNHHERYDGSGYPNALEKHQIDKCSSIIAISDTFEALTNHRSYKKKLETFKALKLMVQDEKYNKSYLKVAIASLG